MKATTLLFLIVFASTTLAQEKINTSNGRVFLEASVPLFEEVQATNEKATCLIKPKNGEILVTIFIKDFKFKIPLMENHFNENYLESHKYPKASFKGLIEGFNWNNIGIYAKEFIINGTMKIHGKSKIISTIALIKKTNNALDITSTFMISTKDYNIKIPEMLSMKVAETVNVKTLFSFNNPILTSNP